MSLCFKVGLYKQGLLHDLSKYSPSEFLPSVKYFQGDKSPITKEKEEKGYSDLWLHHKGRNKHHWEYWIDRKPHTSNLEVMAMPYRYMMESTLDKIAASKVYNKDKYTDATPYDFFTNSLEYTLINPKTSKQISDLLLYLKENGEKKALAYYKSQYKLHKDER